MMRVRLDDFRFPKVVSTSDRSWPTVAAWQRERLVTVKPLTKSSATVELTDAGLQIANAERKSA